jgi:tetratricopeptide (TPR) repeat protein
MLSIEESAAFARLSVFRGGFGRDAAEAVAGATLAVLAALVDKSLVRRDTRGRYDVHELLRQFAAEKLEGGTDAARDRHAAFYGEVLDRLSAVGGCRVIDGVEQELGNVRAGWDWALERASAAEISRYAGPMFAYYDTRGRFEEGEMACACAARALEAAGAAATPTLARMLSRKGAFAAHRGRFAEARDALERAVELSRGLGNDAELAVALNRLGAVLHHSGEDGPGLEDLVESIAIFRAIGDRAGEALEINRGLGDRSATATSLNDLGYVVSLTGDAVRARPLLEESLAMRRELEYRKGISVTLDILGYVALATGESEAARAYFRESLEIAREIQAVPVALDAANGLAILLGEDRVVALVRDHPAAWAETREEAARRVGDTVSAARDLDEAFALLHS